MVSYSTRAAILFCLLSSLSFLNINDHAVYALSFRNLPRKQGLPIQTINDFGTSAEGLVKRGLTSVGQVQIGHGPSYFVVITLGKINLQVAIDTGSSDLWVISTDCSSPSCHSLPAYPLSFNSPSFSSVNNNQTAFNISYADGTSASGFVARENVTIYNATSTNQAFALVNKMDLSFNDNISGILGLGFSRLSMIAHSTPNATSFIGSLAVNGVLEYPIFGLSIPNSNVGSLTLGAVDALIVNDTNKIIWHSVTPFASDNDATDPSASYLHWTLQLTGITANGQTIQPIPSYPNITKSSLALLDVGATGLYGPYQDVARLFNSLDIDSRLVNEGQWVVSCSTTATIAFNFGNPNLTVVLEPRDYIIGVASGDPGLCLAWPQALPPNNLGIDWQLGIPFLKKVYSVYSYGINGKEAPMIGLMPLPISQTTSFASQTSTASTSQITSPAAINTTISTTLPNFPLPTTTSQPTSSYALNTSAGIPSLGSHPTTDLAISTYKPILHPLNASAIPTIEPAASKQTFIITDSAGTHTEISTSIIPAPSVPLGAPPGFGAAGRLSMKFSWTMSSSLLLIILVLCGIF